MPANTPNQNYPYPVDTDVIDVAGDIESLAVALDSDISDTIAIVDNKVSVSGDTMTGMLTLPGTDPTSLNHAARRGWIENHFVREEGDTMSGDLDMDFHRIHNLAKAQSDGDAVRLDQLVNKTENFLSKNVEGNQTMEGSLAAPRFFITDAASPDGPNQAAPKSYVDDRLDGMVQVSGDTMTGALTIGGNWLLEEPAVLMHPSGYYRSTVTAAGNANMTLNRSTAANVNNDPFVLFNVDVDAAKGQVQRGDDAPAGVRYLTTSDSRLKERLGPIGDAAERVQTLARAAFTGRWVGGRNPRDMLSAQDIAEIAPYAVNGEPDGDLRRSPMMVSYGDLVPLLVSALGNALDRIASLEAGAS